VSRRDLAVDLGSSNTLVYRQGHGVVYNEPTVCAVNSRTGEVLALGREAWELAQRSPADVTPSRPLHRGVITSFELAEQMFRLILRKLGTSRFPRPRVLVCVPPALTEVERRAVAEAATAAGARSVSLVDEPLAAAIGAGLPIQEPIGSMVADVGGGTSDMAMLALGALVNCKAVPIGGSDMDGAIQTYLRDRFGIAVGERIAEQIKIELGSAYPAADARQAEVRGRDLTTGRPRMVVLSPEDIREVLSEPVRTIVEATRECLAESPPDLAHDVLETGLFMTGGGALLKGLDMRLAQECEVPVHLTEHPLATVVMGAGRLLDYDPEEREAFLAVNRL
jgi:rod shape-determining protein MreB and related proteins